MDTLDKSSRDYEICLCKKLNRGYVEDLIKEKNIKTLKELCEIGDIGNVCGGCREDLDMVLEEILNGEVSKYRERASFFHFRGLLMIV